MFLKRKINVKIATSYAIMYAIKVNLWENDMNIQDYVDGDLLDKFEFYNYNHALEIITQAFPERWAEVVECLRRLKITVNDLREAAGNETNIPKKFDDVLYPYGWREIRISGDLHIKFYPRQAEQRG